MQSDYYDRYIYVLASHLDKTYNYQSPTKISNRDKIRYYLTTKYVHLPPELDFILHKILKHEIEKESIIDVSNFDNQITLLMYDITQIKADVIVNAANADGLGCFQFNHKCVDNIIHNKAGPNLRLECKTLLKNSKIPTGGVLITRGHNLPSKYIIHTVGPIYNQTAHNQCVEQLKECYDNCLKLATKYKLKSIVFSCISAGLYGFPADEAAQIAISTIKSFIENTNIKVIFSVYTLPNYEIYQKILKN